MYLKAIILHQQLIYVTVKCNFVGMVCGIDAVAAA